MPHARKWPIPRSRIQKDTVTDANTHPSSTAPPISSASARHKCQPWCFLPTDQLPLLLLQGLPLKTTIKMKMKLFCHHLHLLSGDHLVVCVQAMALLQLDRIPLVKTKMDQPHQHCLSNMIGAQLLPLLMSFHQSVVAGDRERDKRSKRLRLQANCRDEAAADHAQAHAHKTNRRLYHLILVLFLQTRTDQLLLILIPQALANHMTQQRPISFQSPTLMR